MKFFEPTVIVVAALSAFFVIAVLEALSVVALDVSLSSSPHAATPSDAATSSAASALVVHRADFMLSLPPFSLPGNGAVTTGRM